MKNPKTHTICPVILAGGIGSRLWPVSRESYPKQILGLLGNRSLLQETIARIIELVKPNRMIITCNETNRFLIQEQLTLFSNCNVYFDILLEPCGRNTAPAIALASFHQLTKTENSICLVLPADHIITDLANFSSSLADAAQHAEKGKLVTLGIEPTYPEPDYGYIEYSPIADNSGYSIVQFIEKPSVEQAEQLIKSGKHLWNSGMFLFKPEAYLKELKYHCVTVHDKAEQAYQQCNISQNSIHIDRNLFSKLPDISIDYAVMEKTSNGIVIPLNTDWNDIGSWDKLFAAEKKDDNNNVIIGDVIADNIKNCYIRSESRKIAAIDMTDCVIVETADALLVSTQKGSKKVKNIVSQLKNSNAQEACEHTRVYRPWGYYETLIDEKNYKVKLIYVKPNEQLSLQSHQKRNEHWVVVEGVATVTRDQDTFQLQENESTFIPATIRHQLGNQTENDLYIIEVQVGTYLGEDDIVRYTDKYGRIKQTEAKLDKTL